MVRGIDTQMMTTKPADMTAQQSRVNKQNETQMAQNATIINRDTERDAARAVRAQSAEGKRIGTEERERGNASGGEQSEKEPERQEREDHIDPLLLLPVEKGKFAQPRKHYIDIGV